MTPTCMDDYAVDLVQFKLATDPFPGGVPDLPTSLAGELERIRFMLKKMFGFSQWYANSEPITFGSSIGSLTVDGTLTITNESVVTGLNWRLFSTAGTGFTLGDGITPGVFTGTAATYSIPKTTTKVVVLIWASITVNGALNSRFQGTLKQNTTGQNIITGPIAFKAGANETVTYLLAADLYGYLGGSRPVLGTMASVQNFNYLSGAPEGAPSSVIGYVTPAFGTVGNWNPPPGVLNGMNSPTEIDLYIDSVGGVLQIILNKVEVWVS